MNTFAYNAKDIDISSEALEAAGVKPVESFAPQTLKHEVECVPTVRSINSNLLIMAATGKELTLENLVEQYQGWKNEISEEEIVALCESAGILHHLTN